MAPITRAQANTRLLDIQALPYPYPATLPAEFREAIVNYVFLPRDLLNLRLTCTAIEPFATARFYRDLTIELTKSLACQVPFLREKYADPPHRHVRHIDFTIDLQKSGSLNNEKRSHSRSIIVDRIRILPRDRLLSITTPSCLPLDREVMRALLSRQKRLTEICLGRLGGSYIQQQSKGGPWPIKLRTLDIGLYTGDVRDFTSFQIMMGNSHDLEELIIRFYSRRLSSAFVEQAQDSASTDGYISKMLNNPRVFSDGAPRPVLSRLTLLHIDLHHAHRTFTRHIDFTQLVSLNLYRCHGIRQCLQVLRTKFLTDGNSLRCVSLWIDRWEEPPNQIFDSNILIAFLYCLSQLEHLVLDVWSLTAPLGLEWLWSHAQTLKRLYLSIGSAKGIPNAPNQPIYYLLPLRDLKRLCRTCTKLDQLAIALPKAYLDKVDHRRMGTYKAHLYALSRLPNLRILRILNWPHVPPKCIIYKDLPDPHKLNATIFDTYMPGFAHMVARHVSQRFDPPKLRLLTFGHTVTKSLPLETGAPGICYANPRCYLVEPNGAYADELAVRRINAQMLKYHLPDCSDWHKPCETWVKETDW